jgi:hypothetical protein
MGNKYNTCTNNYGTLIYEFNWVTANIPTITQAKIKPYSYVRDGLQNS